MIRAIPFLFLLVALTACSEQNENEAKAAPSPCRSLEFEGSLFTHCRAQPRSDRIVMRMLDRDGAAYRSFERFRTTGNIPADRVAFAMNGGMYDEAGKAIGYYVEDGERLAKLNRNEGPGNFHMLPNGVFLIDGDKWRVMDSETFAAKVRKRPDHATQSGPMLVIGGKLHPDFSENGESRHIRNGVGVDGKGVAHFVISEEPVSFGRFARLFRDRLKTPDALYLDGTVSTLWNPASGRLGGGYPLGPLIIVLKSDKAKP